MKREVVQNFLNLPGITGLALMDGRSRPYFCGVDRSLNFQQKEVLAQGIQQVIDTTPADFDFFEFQFSGHRVYIYKLHHGLILLVLTLDTLSHPAYAEVIEHLKAELQQDVTNTIATFRLLAGSTTLSGQNYWKQEAGSPFQSNLSPAHGVVQPPASSPPEQVSFSGNSLPHQASPISAASSSVNLKDVLGAINHLSQYATQYLGTIVVANYWKTSRPKVDWLTQFQIDRAAQLSLSDGTALSTPLTTEQHQWLRDWVAAFIDRCTKVIRDFPKSLRNAGLDDQQKALILCD
ncbi:hypothetical protein [Egbenema bharatensis]|uniref:hypothetical protein n=1 Tax=Egbenema bharatensis TaxID=3463334 RepID=UPI003A886143